MYNSKSKLQHTILIQLNHYVDLLLEHLYWVAWSVLVFWQLHCRQRAPVGNALPSSGTSQLGMFDIPETTKSKYYDHIVLLYL